VTILSQATTSRPSTPSSLNHLHQSPSASSAISLSQDLVPLHSTQDPQLVDNVTDSAPIALREQANEIFAPRPQYRSTGSPEDMSGSQKNESAVSDDRHVMGGDHLPTAAELGARNSSEPGGMPPRDESLPTQTTVQQKQREQLQQPQREQRKQRREWDRDEQQQQARADLSRPQIAPSESSPAYTQPAAHPAAGAGGAVVGPPPVTPGAGAAGGVEGLDKPKEKEKRFSMMTEVQIMWELRQVVSNDDPKMLYSKIKKVGQG
jgi:hypothetical protein